MISFLYRNALCYSFSSPQCPLVEFCTPKDSDKRPSAEDYLSKAVAELSNETMP
jgi:hypothetical protein